MPPKPRPKPEPKEKPNHSEKLLEHILTSADENHKLSHKQRDTQILQHEKHKQEDHLADKVKIELHGKTNENLEKLAEVTKDGHEKIIETLQEAADKGNAEARSMKELVNHFMEMQRGESGYSPIKGKDYFDGEDGYTPVKGKDYFDGAKGDRGAPGAQGVGLPGKNGYTPIKGVDYFDGANGLPGKDGSPDTAEEIVVKLRSLSKGQRLSYNDLDDIPTIFKQKEAKESGLGGTGYLREITDVAITNPQNGQLLSYNSTSKKWENKTVASGGVSSLNALTGALSIVAGTNITVTPSGTGITIAAAGGTPSLTATQIGFGSGSNILSGSPRLTVNSDGAFNEITFEDVGGGALMSLFIKGDTSPTAQLKLGAGGRTTPGAIYSFESVGGSAGDSVFYTSATDNVAPVETMRLVGSNGYVGIRTNNPAAPLDVHGYSLGAINVTSDDGTQQSYIRFINSGNDAYVGTNSSAGGNLMGGTAPYALVINSSSTAPVQIGSHSNLAMTIDSGAIVTTVNGLVMGALTYPSADATAGYVLTTDGAGNLSLQAPPAASIAIGSAITSSTIGSVLFVDGSNQLAQDNANFFWDASNKRLGIGTASPQVTLDVVSGGTGSAILASFTEPGAFGDSFLQVDIGQSNAANRALVAGFDWSNSTNYGYLNVYGDTPGTQGIVLLQGGHVGIGGVPSGSYALEVVGNINATGFSFINGSSNIIQLKQIGGGNPFDIYLDGSTFSIYSDSFPSLYRLVDYDFALTGTINFGNGRLQLDTSGNANISGIYKVAGASGITGTDPIGNIFTGGILTTKSTVTPIADGNHTWLDGDGVTTRTLTTVNGLVTAYS